MHGVIDPILRVVALSIATLGLVFVVNSYFVIWLDWPGLSVVIWQLGWSTVEPPAPLIEAGGLYRAWLQLAVYVGPLVVIAGYVLRTRDRTLHRDAEALGGLAAYIARFAFWAVLFIGVVDAAISFLRVEGLLADVVGDALASDLGRSTFRGLYVHYPLLGLGAVVAYFRRTIAFEWLALLVVVAELLIVVLRFIYSYEQAFMADLVRFWYAGLFLFSSAYTLLHEGHARIDVLYSRFTERQKAWSNAVGSMLLGIPLCWVVLTMGLASKTSLIASPIRNFEITQAGFGLYVKYLLAGYLLIFALSMLAQFASYFLNNAGVLLHEPDAEAPADQEKLF